MAFSPDGTRLATASQDGTARVWNALEGQELLTLSGRSGAVLGLSYSPNGNWLATASQDGTARVWNAIDKQELQSQILPGHSGIVTSVAFAPNGKHLASAGTDGVVQIYTLDIDELLDLGCKRVTRNLTREEWYQYLRANRIVKHADFINFLGSFGEEICEENRF